jgi:predicted dehydrogenase
VQVGFVYRYAPIFQELYRILNESKVLGKPLFALFRLGGRGAHQEWKHKKELGGGAINEMLVHMLDLALWFFGPVRTVKVLSNLTKLERRVIGEKEILCNAEDFVFLKCRNREGVDIYVESDFITPAFSQYVEVQGENGSFFGSIDPAVPSYLFLKEARGGYEAGKTVFNFGKRDFFAAQVTDFIYSVAVNKWPVKNTVNDSILLMKCMKEAGLNG